MNGKRFALIGAAGYIAPRHMQAIMDVGGSLVAAVDPHDSVGILDQYFPDCLYFREPERFDRHLSKNPVDYVVVCSPNYLHDAHCLMGLRNGADVICEKPLVCNERNLDNLQEWEQMTGRSIYPILQCRLHPEAIRAKAIIREMNYCHIEYLTPRGEWYLQSWKGDIQKSGGVMTNIGIHLFDLCLWLFKPWIRWELSDCSDNVASGSISTFDAEIQWQLSVSKHVKPQRVFKINKESIDLTTGFADLHTESYRRILTGQGFNTEDARPAIRLVEIMRDGCA
ncbi:MAG: Gfo/Idh/MocA family oxidoreductase [Sphaerochaeta sp.]|jgi:UDP-N-acetyl-2-amino-2-deoxyglucuronate dehydrogenase|nr:Gfo/Idh/MocA family oxidoreductase [Sphaerochaeta sp.]